MNAVVVSNLEQALKPIVGASHLTQAISSSAVAASSIANVHADAKFFYIQVETATVRLTLNGTAPTSSVGFRRVAGWEGILSRSEFLASKWIRESADATLQIAQLG